MRQLSRVEGAIFLMGGLLMVAGAAASLLAWAAAPWVFAFGAICFASMQMKQRYEGPSFTIRRLRRMMLLSDVLFLVAALLMFASQGNFLGLDQTVYVMYVYRKWVVVLLIAAILQLYSIHRIGHELGKEE